MTRRKDGRWQEAIVLNGKRKYFYGKSKAEVLRKIASAKEQKERGMLMQQVCTQWQESRALRYNTYQTYKLMLKNIIEYFGEDYITEITPKQVNNFIKGKEREGYSHSTISIYLSVLNMVFRYAITDLDINIINPCDNIRLSRDLPKTIRQLPSESDIAAIKAHASDNRFSLFPYFLYCTGMRIGEALAITRDDIKNNFINVTKKVSWQPSQPVIDNFLKTHNGNRRIVLLNILADKLPPKWDGYLFSNTGKLPYTYNEFKSRWQKYKKETGVQCTLHQLRHNFATILFDADIDSKEAAEMMGHNEKIMREIYTHITDQRRQLSIEKLNNANNAYYNSGNPIMDDGEYDFL